MNDEIIKRLIPVTAEEKCILEGCGNIDREIYMHDGSDMINAKKLLEKGKIITLRAHTRFVHFPEHTHDFVEVIYMCSGKTTHIINGEKIVLNCGELLFLGRNAVQEILPASKNDIAVNFIILPAFFDKVLDMLGNEETPLKSFVADSLKGEDGNGVYLHFKVADVLPVQNLVENLVWNLLYDEENSKSINSVTMGLLFLQLLNLTDRLEYRNKKEQNLMYIFRYIEEHYCDGELKELADILHYDFSWLSREIKQRTGKTYTELIQDKRLSKAAFFLRSTSVKVSEIAVRTGYANISYFHRIFKKKYGVSPAQYRKQKG